MTSPELAEVEGQECHPHTVVERDELYTALALVLAGERPAAHFAKFAAIVGRYQEQPQLLDPLLADFLGPLGRQLESLVHSCDLPVGGLDPASLEDIVGISCWIWKLVVVRGRRTVVRFLPNTAASLEPVALLLSQFQARDTKTLPKTLSDGAREHLWEAECVLLLWLSGLVLAPFDLATLDSQGGVSADDSSLNAAPLASTLCALCRGYLASASRARDMAAEALGRLLGRPDMHEKADDAAWHGGCLALAEVARRRLLKPHSAEAGHAIPALRAALVFDVRRGPCSIGAHVRDAAAYVCWALARAWASGDLRDILAPTLLPALIAAACLDREVNCRRAAAAAFQECVGRLGAWPDGIAILSAADYFTVSNRKHAYTVVARQVAAFAGYFLPMAQHLLDAKLQHWEKSLRELAAIALANLVDTDREWFVTWAVPELLSRVLSVELERRHGAVAALAELMLVLRPEELAPFAAELAGIIPRIEAAKLNRGKGGEVMRTALCRFVEALSLSGIALTRAQVETACATVLDSLRCSNADGQAAAVAALGAFCPVHGAERLGGLVSMLLAWLRGGATVAEREGAAKGLAALRPMLLLDRDCCAGATTTTVQDGIKNTLPGAVATALQGAAGSTLQDPAVRAAALSALVRLAAADDDAGCSRRASPENSHAPTEDQHVMLDAALAACFSGVKDYTLDNRGDVGSWVREAALRGLPNLLVKWGRAREGADASSTDPAKDSTWGPARDITLWTGELVRLAADRIGRVRAAAWAGLAALRGSCGDSCFGGEHRVALLQLLGQVHIPDPESSEDAVALQSLCSFLAASPQQTPVDNDSKGVLSPPPRLQGCIVSCLAGLAYAVGGKDAQLSSAAGAVLVQAAQASSRTRLGISEALFLLWNHAIAVRRATAEQAYLALLAGAAAEAAGYEEALAMLADRDWAGACAVPEGWADELLRALDIQGAGN